MVKKNTQKKNSLISFNNLSPKQSVQYTKFKGYGEEILLGIVYLKMKHNNFYYPIDQDILGDDPRDMMWKILISWKL